MKITILLAIWAGIPALICAHSLWRVWRLRNLRLHDWLLYRFCEVRDIMAVKAAKGELDENSAVFKFFYVECASLIHHHKLHGVCFKNFAQRALAALYRAGDASKGPMPVPVKQLIRQLKHADDEIQNAAALWNLAFAIMMGEADRGMWLERSLWKLRRNRKNFFRWLSSQSFVSRDIRNAALLISSISKAVGQSPCLNTNEALVFS